MKLRLRNHSLDLSQKTLIMGILNVTPDSFSDGGTYFSRASAIDRALQMADEGADIIDIGGESTRPGAEPVSLEEELDRTIPVITELARKLSIPISIDTYKAEVARRALEAGASIVNDISGLRFDPKMAETIAAYDAAVVIMHIKGTPKDMQVNPHYDDLFGEIISYLKEGIEMARSSGIDEEGMIVDPGIGFGKRPEHNLLIINQLKRFTVLDKPILMGVSRKSFIGIALDNAPPQERLEGTAAAVALSVYNGAHIVRVHDVKEMVRVVRVVDAIKREAF